MTDFGIRLRQAMEAKNISAAELSRKSGVGKNMISYYLNGKCLAKQDKVYALAMALNVQPGWLMTGVEQTVTIPDSAVFRKIMLGMSPEDFNTVMRILEKTEVAMRERGDW